MGGKALAFELAHPSEDESHAGVVARLQSIIEKADNVLKLERRGSVGESAARAQRHIARRTLHARTRHLVRVAAVAAREQPQLMGKFIPPKYNGPNRVFVIAAKQLLDAAIAEESALLGFGLGTKFVAQLREAITVFESAGSDADEGRSAHIIAAADLALLAPECITLVRLLDGLNAARFEKEPELLATWKSARNVYGPFLHRDGEEPDEDAADMLPLLPPGAGEVSATL
jgi:hypothetical protein